MGSNGNGSNGKYTAQQFIDAIEGTGGVVSSIAEKVGCAWNTAKKYIDNYATVKQAWQNERNRITDRAQNNIIKSINKGDLQMSKWWLQVMDGDFNPPPPPQKLEHSGPGGVAIPHTLSIVEYEDPEADKEA